MFDRQNTGLCHLFYCIPGPWQHSTPACQDPAGEQMCTGLLHGHNLQTRNIHCLSLKRNKNIILQLKKIIKSFEKRD